MNRSLAAAGVAPPAVIRPESTVAPKERLLFGPIRPPEVMFRRAVVAPKFRSMLAPVSVSEFTAAPAAGTGVAAVRRTFLEAVEAVKVLVRSYCGAPVWLSAATPTPGI